MSSVFVVDQNRTALNPIHPGRARILLSSGRAAVLKRYPFTILLKRVVDEPCVKPLRLKLDPGSKTTGMAIVNDTSGQVVFAAELRHRGQAIQAALETRRASRRSRRQRKTRYRKGRFNNRRRRAGWLPPSLESRIANVLTWVHRLHRLCPITDLSLEVVKFDTQMMENADIQGVEYQQGTLQGYEIREWLLEKWNRQCAYCGVTGVPLQVEHIRPRAKAGGSRVSNLVMACEPCNRAKCTQDIEVFLANKPSVLKRILAQVRSPLKDVAAVNATRWALYERLKAIGLPIECGSGGLTKYNRTVRSLPKTHWLDAVCVGKWTPETLGVAGVVPLFITAMGRQRRQMCLMDRFGFPRTKAKHKPSKHSFRTGDIVKAVVPTHLKHAGVHVGRMSSKANGSFTIATASGTVTDIGYRYCTRLQCADGYAYQQRGGSGFLPIP